MTGRFRWTWPPSGSPASPTSATSIRSASSPGSPCGGSAAEPSWAGRTSSCCPAPRRPASISPGCASAASTGPSRHPARRCWRSAPGPRCSAPRSTDPDGVEGPAGHVTRAGLARPAAPPSPRTRCSTDPRPASSPGPAPASRCGATASTTDGCGATPPTWLVGADGRTHRLARRGHARADDAARPARIRRASAARCSPGRPLGPASRCLAPLRSPSPPPARPGSTGSPTRSRPTSTSTACSALIGEGAPDRGHMATASPSLDAVEALVPFLRAPEGTSRPTASSSPLELIDDPDLLAATIAATGPGRGSDDPQVAGLALVAGATRTGSPARPSPPGRSPAPRPIPPPRSVAAWAWLGADRPRWWWAPRQRSVADLDELVARLFADHLDPLATSLRARHTIGERLLWGNAAAIRRLLPRAVATAERRTTPRWAAPRRHRHRRPAPRPPRAGLVAGARPPRRTGAPPAACGGRRPWRTAPTAPTARCSPPSPPTRTSRR